MIQYTLNSAFFKRYGRLPPMIKKLIIGLGNPDEEYENTRHNLGFMFLDFLAKKADAEDFEFDKKSNSLLLECSFAFVSKEKADPKAIKIALAKPQTYVNNSGMTAAKLRLAYKIKPEDIIVIQDDLDIEFGNTKLSFDKNSGGHNGIESIIKALKTKKFHRIRIGTGKSALDKARQQSDKKRDEFVSNFVLGKFTPTEREKIKGIFKEVYEKLALCTRQ
jgi:PTH1 family peptidyl-tRNA hydrolase